DYPASANAGVGKVFVAVCQGDPCGANTYLSTNSATGQFNAAQTYLLASTVSVNSGVYTWSLPVNGVPGAQWGSSGTKYHILVRSSDTVNNLETSAASASASAGVNTSNNVFTYTIPSAAATITSPDATTPHWTPAVTQTSLLGGTQNATTAQVQIIDCGT